MKELKFTITGTIFVPDDADYEYTYENQIYSFTIGDETYSLIAGLESDEMERVVTDSDFESHKLTPLEYEDAFFED